MADAKPKLSALIRQGAAMVNGRQVHFLFRDYDEQDQLCVCALGAAYLALTREITPAPLLIDHVWDEIAVATDNPDYVLRLVTDFNDYYRLTFDEIAAKLEARGL